MASTGSGSGWTSSGATLSPPTGSLSAAAAARIAARFAAARAALAFAALDRAALVFATDSVFAAAVLAAAARAAVADAGAASVSSAATVFFGADLVAAFRGVALAVGFFGTASPGVAAIVSAAAFARAALGRTAAARGVAVACGGALRAGALRTGVVRPKSGAVTCVSAESGAADAAFCSSGSGVGGAGVTSLTYQGPSDSAGSGGHRQTQSPAARHRVPGSRKQHGKGPLFPPGEALVYFGIGITVCLYVNL